MEKIKWAVAAAAIVLIGAGCSSGPSEAAEDSAELYCTLEGVLPSNTSIYSDEFARCVEQNAPRFEEE